jgi:hypothetical protein
MQLSLSFGGPLQINGRFASPAEAGAIITEPSNETVSKEVAIKVIGLFIIHAPTASLYIQIYHIKSHLSNCYKTSINLYFIKKIRVYVKYKLTSNTILRYTVSMTKSIIFKVDDKTKLMVEQKAKKLNITVSEYLRLLVNNNLESRKNNNPLLKLANTLTPQESDMMMKSIKSDRVNRK